MAKGDHIKVKRSIFLWFGYWHHGIDCGDGTIIHYGGKRHMDGGIHVQRVSINIFLDGGKPVVIHYSRCFPPHVVVKNAEECLGERGFSSLFNNCEHFARLCKTGNRRSQQVRRAVALSSAVIINIIGLTTDFFSFATALTASCGLFLYSRLRS